MKQVTYIVKTSADNILCENGQTRWSGVVGPGGYAAKIFKSKRAAQKAADRFLSVGGRIEETVG